MAVLRSSRGWDETEIEATGSGPSGALCSVRYRAESWSRSVPVEEADLVRTRYIELSEVPFRHRGLEELVLALRAWVNEGSTFELDLSLDSERGFVISVGDSELLASPGKATFSLSIRSDLMTSRWSYVVDASCAVAFADELESQAARDNVS